MKAVPGLELLTTSTCSVLISRVSEYPSMHWSSTRVYKWLISIIALELEDHSCSHICNPSTHGPIIDHSETMYNLWPLKIHLQLFQLGVTIILFVGSAPPAKSHPVANLKHPPAKGASKHQGASKPVWLLALEIATGTMVGSLFLVAMLTALQKCNSKSSIIIPWKKSASGKDHMTICIGSVC